MNELIGRKEAEAKRLAQALVRASRDAISAALKAQMDQLEKEYGGDFSAAGGTYGVDRQ